MNKFDLNNRVAVVTGGAQGFGFAITERFIQSGAKVIIWDIDKEAAEIAHKADNKVSLTLSDPFCVERHRDEFKDLVKKHIDIVNKLLEKGFAYKCYCSEKEIEEEKNRAKQKKLPYIYNKKCRNLKEVPKNIDPVIRFKSKIEGDSILNDLVQGEVKIENKIIEDFVILRKDGTPTYNLSAAVDDYEMGITHIIRGDDHKMNTFKQMQIFQNMNWDLPIYVHIPLIHTSEGKKLSKRDKASTLEDYKKIGIMPDALRNYLLRLGWSFKDKEIFTLDESIKHFNIEGIGKSPSKLDMSRILSMNEHYIKNMNENDLFDHLIKYCESYKDKIDNKGEKIKKSLIFLKNKAKTLEDIFNNAQYLIKDKIQISTEDIKLLDNLSKTILKEFLKEFWEFLKVRKKYWLLPIILVLVLFGGLIILSQGSVVAPFIYTIF